MCLIVDANIAGLVFADHPSEDFLPIHQWMKGNGKIVYGGKLKRELAPNKNWQRLLLQGWKRSGRAHEEDDAVIDAETERVARLPLESDDPHVLALARVSGARTLCTHDRDLMADFKNTSLVPNPQGNIYQQAKHSRLLKHRRKGCRYKPTIRKGTSSKRR